MYRIINVDNVRITNQHNTKFFNFFDEGEERSTTDHLVEL